MDHVVRLDLATESARRCFSLDLEPDFTGLMVRRIRRKFKVKVTGEEVERVVAEYKRIWKFARSVMPKCLRPPAGQYASWEDVDHAKLARLVAAKVPSEHPDILKKVNDLMVFNCYIR